MSENNLRILNVEEIGKTDAEKAKDIRAKLMPILEQAADIMTIARNDGFEVGFNVVPDSFGRTFRVAEIIVRKPL